jgi:hypothetical protein
MQSPYKNWGPLAAAATVGVVLFAGLILSIRATGYPVATQQAGPLPNPLGLTPAGRFRKVRSLSEEVDGDIRDNLAASTRFVPGGTSSDAVLHVELYLASPSRSGSYYTMADMTMVYKATVLSISGKRLWSGTGSTRQPLTFPPGIHTPGPYEYRRIFARCQIAAAPRAAVGRVRDKI